MKNENEFLDKFKNHIKNGNYFLFGCDSKDIIDKYYNACKETDTDNEN